MKLITIIVLMMIFAPGVNAECPIPQSLKKLINISIEEKKEDGEQAGIVAAMRPKTIKEAAYTVGMQNGVSWCYGNITTLLDKVNDALDRIFDFRGVMYSEFVTPAIILKADDSYIIKDSKTAIRSKTTYRIHKLAKIVSRPPDWRDYLWHDFDAMSEVNKVLHPKDEKELNLWQTAIINGWNDGVDHAINTFEVNMNKLIRDYIGMSRAHILAANKMIEEPTIATGRKAVHKGKNCIDINQEIIRITTDTKFTDKKEWDPSINVH